MQLNTQYGSNYIDYVIDMRFQFGSKVGFAFSTHGIIAVYLWVCIKEPTLIPSVRYYVNYSFS